VLRWRALRKDVCLGILRGDMIQRDNFVIPFLSEIPSPDIEVFDTCMTVWVLCKKLQEGLLPRCRSEWVVVLQ
jgi:hypothetical protein